MSQRFVRFAASLATFLAIAAGETSTQAQTVRQVIPPTGAQQVRTLSQNWSHETAEWFYNLPQGSKLLPYDWFINLEQPSSLALFREPAHFASLGYIARTADAENPEALAVGFVRDGQHVGMTCAACHTGMIQHQGTAFLIDGGQTLGDFETFLRRLQTSLEQTAVEGPKFNRFAARVAGLGATVEEKQALLTKLQNVTTFRSNYNFRNLPRSAQKAFGPGRVDAIGAIFNEVTTIFVKEPENFAEATAPVSYPFLWDAPQHDRVQWNGSIPNFVVPGMEPFAGTEHIGALGRNAGEVIGVFGYVDLEAPFGQAGYAATVEKANLIDAEGTLRTLWSPQWPAELGEINPVDAFAGKILFKKYCASCHDDRFDRTSPTRKVKAVLTETGTDPLMAFNYATQTARAGVLEGRIKTLPGLGRFGDTAIVNQMLFHVAVLMTIGPQEPIETPYIPAEQQPQIQPAQSSPSTSKQTFPLYYKGRPLNGIWATAPYLHNGSVPNLDELLKPPAERIKQFRLGTQQYDTEKVGYKNAGGYLFDTTLPGNSNAGHDYGPGFTPQQRRQLIAYMKSL